MDSNAPTNACVRWDLTIPQIQPDDSIMNHPDVIAFFKDHCKSWCFQLEKGDETGYMHFQCRITLKVKNRTPWKLGLQGHWSPTSAACRNSMYVTKPETRVDGPWSDKDKPPREIPWQIADVHTLRSFQQRILDSSKVENREKRIVNCIVCPKGDNGKTTLTLHIKFHKLGRFIPPVSNYKDFMQMLMCMVDEDPNCPLYIIDMPRALPKKNQEELYAGIESLKDGIAFDTRYKYKDEVFHSPAVWVFTNSCPDIYSFTYNRWKFWKIVGGALLHVSLTEVKELKEKAFVPVPEDYDDYMASP